MAKIFTGTTKSFNSVTWTYDIYDDSGITGSGTQVTIESAETTWDGKGSRLYEKQLIPSQTELGISVSSAAIETALKAMAVGTEQKHALAISKNGTLHWFGIILIDKFTFPRAAWEGNYTFNLVAEDKLTVLDGVTFDFGGWGYDGSRQTGIEIIRTIIQRNYTPWLGLWSGTDMFIGDAITHTCSNMDSGVLFNTSYKKERFYKNFDISEDPDKYEWVSCKEAIEGILKAWGAKMIHDKGAFLIYQCESHEGLTTTFKKYAKDGSDLSSNYSLSNGFTVNGVSPAARPCFEAKPIFGWQPAIRDYRVEFERENWVFSSKDTKANDPIVLSYNSIVESLHTLKLKGRIRDAWANKIITGGVSATVRFAEVYCTLIGLSGGNWFIYSFSGKEWINRGAKPSFVPGSQWVIANKLQSDPPVAGGIDFEIEAVQPSNIEFSEIECTINVYGYYYVWQLVGGKMLWMPKLNTWLDWEGYLGIAESYTDSNWYNNNPDEDIPQVYRDESYFSCASTNNVNNSTRVQDDIWFYSGSEPDLGGVLTRKSGTWYDNQDFSYAFSGQTGDIPKLLTSLWMGLYEESPQWIQGTILSNGNLLVCQSISIDSLQWTFNGGTYNYRHDTLNGEWIEVSENHSGTDTGDKTDRTNYNILRQYKTRIEELQRDVNRIGQAVNAADQLLAMQIINQSDFTNPGGTIPIQMSFNIGQDDTSSQWKAQEGYHIIKTEDQSRASDILLATDNTLSFFMKEYTIYYIKMKVYFSSPVAADYQYRLIAPGSLTDVMGERYHIEPGTTTKTEFIDTALWTPQAVLSTSEFGGVVDIDIKIETGPTSGTFAYQWAQNSSDAGNTITKNGSSIYYRAEPVQATSDYLLTADGDYIIVNVGEKLKQAK